MKMKVYQAIARKLDAMLTCHKTGNEEWYDKHNAAIVDIMAGAPSGAGIDSGTEFSFNASTPKRLVFLADYHHMDESGMYDGWTEHEVIVTASLMFGFDLRVTGRNRDQIKDYLSEIYQEWLDSEAEEV